MAFRTSVQVRFGDVDHAGIVYYPRFYIYFHEAFEDFFYAAGMPYHEMVGEARPASPGEGGAAVAEPSLRGGQRVGFPTVHVSTDFKSPLRYGDSLDIELSVPKVGNRSATFRYVGYRHRDGQHCVTAEITTACVDLSSFHAMEIPAPLRALFSRFTT